MDVTGGLFLLCRGSETPGRCVLWACVPAVPVWEPAAEDSICGLIGLPGRWGMGLSLSRRVERISFRCVCVPPPDVDAPVWGLVGIAFGVIGVVWLPLGAVGRLVDAVGFPVPAVPD